MEEFYGAHKAASQVDLCPMHEPAVFELFKERGYAIAELNNVLFRTLDAQEEFPPPPAGCEIRPSRVEEAETAGAIVESAFFPDGAPEAYRGLIAPFYQIERALAFVASVEGKLVACGTGLVIPEHRVFALCGAGTLAKFRGRGLQTTLLRARMAAAAQAGCEYAVVVTNGGTTSQRNAERLGFRVAYSKVTSDQAAEGVARVVAPATLRLRSGQALPAVPAGVSPAGACRAAFRQIANLLPRKTNLRHEIARKSFRSRSGSPS